VSDREETQDSSFFQAPKTRLTKHNKRVGRDRDRESRKCNQILLYTFQNFLEMFLLAIIRR